MIGRWEARWRRFRRRTSRSEWAIRLLGLPHTREVDPTDGLVMVQIDGLSRTQLDRALASGKMPFLKSLLDREHYRLHNFYSGLPSSTPGVQGELFYGVKSIVPAFSFKDHRTGRIVKMFDPDEAVLVERRLDQQGEGILRGGSAYCDIYTGGAKEAHFCASTIGLDDILRTTNPLLILVVMLTNLYSILRIGVLTVLEVIIAIVDFFRGLISGMDLIKELKFIPTRIAISIALREFIVIGSKIDVSRGLPVVHMNFLGYDEQAHRRGPDSEFAHWALKGIDDAIKRIWTAAHSSLRREYDLWVYSDHGQEHTIPYPDENGRTIQEALNEVFEELQMEGRFRSAKNSIERERVRILGPRISRWLLYEFGAGPPEPEPAEVAVTAMGPVGFIYTGAKLTLEDKGRIAPLLVSRANIPLVIVPDGPGQAMAWTRSGQYRLPDDAGAIIGADHPYLDEARDDLITLAHHEDAGDFVILGWRLGKLPISFPQENGSHAGPGPQETSAFALLPSDAPVPVLGRGYLRPIDLHNAVMRKLRPEYAEADTSAPSLTALKESTEEGRLRVMTYNVHSCIGMDGRHLPERIARVIAQYDPDIVALQELDVRRKRTANHDQAQTIARLVEMEFHFHPALKVEEELYGDAILTRFPMRVIKSGELPTHPNRNGLEPRGAIWVEIDVNGRPVHFINTHLGLTSLERSAQVEALLGPEWLGSEQIDGPVILAGDFNALPNMHACKQICSRLHDAQILLEGHRPKKTFFGRYPVGRIDHIFISDDFEVSKVRVPNSRLAKVASDHLPLIVDLRLRTAAEKAETPATGEPAEAVSS